MEQLVPIIDIWGGDRGYKLRKKFGKEVGRLRSDVADLGRGAGSMMLV
jgi:hypothetical protein